MTQPRQLPATLVHLGYDGDMTAKWRRNLPLLRVEVIRDPARIYYWNDLAATLAGLGEVDEALAVAREGLMRPAPADRTGRIMRSTLLGTYARLLLQRGEDALDRSKPGWRSTRPTGRCAS